jgi:uracil-DNA glycosylase
MRIYSIRNPSWKFGHGALYQMENGTWVLCSYHPSQQNTQTGRLTAAMFDEIWTKARSLLR